MIDDDLEVLKKGTMEYQLFRYVLDCIEHINKEMDNLRKVRHLISKDEFDSRFSLLDNQLKMLEEIRRIKLMNPKEGCNGFMLEE